MSGLVLFLVISASINGDLFDRFASAVIASDSATCIELADSIVDAVPRKEKNRVVSMLASTAMARNRYDIARMLILHFRNRFHDNQLLASMMRIIYAHQGDYRLALYEQLNSIAYGKIPLKYAIRNVAYYDMFLSPKEVDKIVLKWQKDHKDTKIGYVILAQRKYLAGDLDGAVKIIKEKKLSSLSLASIAIEKGDYELAIRIARAEKKDSARAFYILGVSYLQEGDSATGIEFLRRAAMLKNGAEARQKLVELALALGDTTILIGLPLKDDEKLPVWYCTGGCGGILEGQSVSNAAIFYRALCYLELDSTRKRAFALMDTLIYALPASKYARIGLRIRSFAILSDTLSFRRLVNMQRLELCGRLKSVLDSLNSMLAETNDPGLKNRLMLWKASVLHELGQDSLAMAVLWEVEPPYRPMALWRIFKISSDIGKMDIAQKAYDELVTKYPKSPFAQMAIGMM